MNTALKYPVFPEDPEPNRPQPKRKRRWWRIIGFTLLGLITFIVVALFLLASLVNTDGEHRAIMNFARSQASKALGVQVNLQNLLIHWYPLGIDIYGVRVEGAGPHPNPPLLQINHVQVGVHVVSFLQAKWYLSSVRIDHPVVWVSVDKNGISNIPSFTSSNTNSSSNNTIFDLGIRHAVLDRGEVFYNNQPRTLAADLYHLDLRAAFSPPQKMYSGRLSYSDGHLKFGAYQPIPHNFDATFSLTPTTAKIDQATLSSGDSQVVLSAVVNNYQIDPAMQAHYRIAVDATQFRNLLHSPTIPAGFIHATGSMTYHKQPNKPLLQDVVLHGDLTSPKLDVSTANAQAVITGLAAHYSIDNGNASLHDLRAGVLGGQITAQGAMTNLGGDSHSKFTAELHGISLAQLKQKVGNAVPTHGVGLAGTVNGTASATWGKTMADLAVRTDLSIQGQVSGGQEAAAAGALVTSAGSPQANQVAATNTTIPVNGQIHASYKRSDNQLILANSHIQAGTTNLTLNGGVGKHSALSLHLNSVDLGELASIINTFRSAKPGQQPLELSGTGSFNGTVKGSVTAPHLTGELAADNVKINGSDWKMVKTGIDMSPTHAWLENGVFEPVPHGTINLNARIGLNHFAFSKQSPLQVHLHASQLALADLIKFSGKQIPVTGTMQTDLNLHGSVANPDGNGYLTLTDVTAYQQPVQSVKVDFSAHGAQAQANLAVNTTAGDVHANVTVRPNQRTYTAKVTSSGIHLSELAAIKSRDLKVDGIIGLSVNGQGSFDNPQLQATVNASSLTVSKEKLSAIKLQLNLANHVANASLDSVAFNAPLQAKAAVQLTGDYLTDASFNTPVMSLHPLLAIYSPSQANDLSGEAQIQATLHGPLKNMKQVEAHLSIPVLKMAYQNKIQLAAASPIQINYRDGVLDVPSGSIRGTGTDIQFQGHIPTGSSQPMSLQIRGGIDLALAQLFNPDIASSGQLKLNIDSHGVLTKGADIGGEVDVVDASFADPSMPVGLEHGNGVLKLTTDRINIASFQGKVGGGTVTMQGGVQYRPNLVFAVGMAAKGIRMLYPQGMRESIDANIRLDGTTTHAVLGGTVGLTNLSFTPAFDLTSVAGQLSGGVAGPPPMGFTQNLKLDLAVHSASAMNLVSRQLSVDGSANLQIRGTAAQPVVLGRINLTGGDIILNGNRFVLSGGTIQFVNPMETEPVLNLSLTTTIQEYKIDLRFEGPATRMHTEYTSDPSLPPADIIHLLAFGSTVEASANNPTPANQQAEALIASQVSSQLTSRISKVAGISQLSISPVLQGGGAQGPAGADITIRQRVTGNLFITFSTNVAATQDQIIQGQYQVSPRVAISGTRDQNGGFGVDALIKKTW